MKALESNDKAQLKEALSDFEKNMGTEKDSKGKKALLDQLQFIVNESDGVHWA